MADLDIEETNRLRAALGMAPIPSASNNSSDLQFKPSASKGGDDEDSDDPGSTIDTRQAAAGDNWKKVQHEAEEKKRREERRAKLKKERDAAQRFAKLEGKGLGEGDDAEIDTRSWLLGTNKRQKKIEKQRARMLQKELEERENQAQYTEKDLKGQRVAHELGEFDEGGEHILTLKDADIGEESGDDELENANLRDVKEANERSKLKVKKPQYDPNAEENEAGKSLLGKYDEEIEGKKKSHFTLDGMGRTEEERNGSTGAQGRPQGMQFHLDLPADEKPTSDYMDISEIKVKKPKKKKDKTRKRQNDDEDDMFAVAGDAAPNQDAMEVEPQQTNGASKRKHEDTSFADDEDLQSTLANSRREALKKRKRARPVDLARQLREEATPDSMETNENEDGLIIDETSEFLSNLQKPKAPEERRASSLKPSKRETTSASVSPQPPDADVPMKDDPASSDEENLASNPHYKPEPSPQAPDPHTATGLADEETFTTTGLGSTLGMLSQRGILKSNSGSAQNMSHSRQAEFIAARDRLASDFNARAAEKRKRDRDAGVFERMSKRQQEEYAQQENKQRDTYVSRQLDDLFNRQYKPDVDLKYVDEFGRHMDSREAFKQMSHQFHGKGSGKLKTEKRLKRIEEERAREAKSALDAGGQGYAGAGRDQSRRKGLAGVRLQ